MKSKRITAFLLIASLSLLTGCTGKSKAPTVEADLSPILSTTDDLVGNDQLVIGSITMISGGEWYGEVLSGIKTASEDLGVTLIQEDSASDLKLEEQQIQKFIDDKVDAIVICPITADKTGERLLEAERAGIPVVTWNTVVDADITAEVCVDPSALGGATGDYLVEYIRTYDLSGLKVGMITNESYTIGVARCDGFREAVKPLEEDGSITIVSEMLAETTEETNITVKEMLSKHSDLDIIWCWNQTSLLECINVAKEMGKSDLIILGTDMSMSIAQDMLSDSINVVAVTTQLPYNLGYKAVVNAVRASKGQAVDKTIMIPTFTYINSDTDDLEQYIESHAEFAK